MSKIFYDQITLDRIEFMHPILREELKEQYLEINMKLPKGVRLRFTSTFRTEEEQNELFAKRPKVTNAKGGQSIHNIGLAFDIVILKQDNKGNWLADWSVDKYWLQVAEFFKSKGWEWGGDWSFKDYPHFELTKGKNWRYFASLPKIKDNGIEYPKIS